MAVAMQVEDFPVLPSGPAEINKMIKEHGDLFSDSQCKVCSAVLNSESQKLTHYQSKKHANKVRRYISTQKEKEPAPKKLKSSSDDDYNNGDTDSSKVCHLCNMTFTSPVMAQSHYQSKGHAKNLRLRDVGPQKPAAPPQPTPAAQTKKKPAEEPSGVPVTDGSSNNSSNNPDRFCPTCQASFNNPNMAQQHYEGKKHRKQMTKLKLMETYGPSTAQASSVNGYPCTICNIELNSVAQYQSHISGAKHKNQMKKSGIVPTEKENPPDQSTESNKQPSATDEKKSAPTNNQSALTTDQFNPTSDQLLPIEDPSAPTDEEFPPTDDPFGPTDDDFGPTDDDFAPIDQQFPHQYSPYSEYTGEYELT